MSFKNEAKKTEFVSIGKGNFPARIVHLIDMGKQHIKGYNKTTKQWFPLYYAKDENGNDIKDENGYTKQVADDTGFPVIKSQYRVTYEFPTKTREFGGQQMPRWVKKEYFLSGLEKLANMLTDGDIEALVGTACFVNVDQTTGGYDKVVSTAPAMEGFEVPELKNPPVLFDFDAPVKEQWDNIPTWYIDDIKAAVNYEGSTLQKMVDTQSGPANTQTVSDGFDDFDDDIIKF